MEWPQELANEALVLVERDLQELDPELPFAESNRLVWRGYRARALALADNWSAALEEVEWLSVNDHDELTWVEARLHCFHALGRSVDAAQAEWIALFEEVGLAAPDAPEPWP
jgi:hypothetical protein